MMQEYARKIEEVLARQKKEDDRAKGFAQSLLAIHQALGEHALDLQWLFTHSRWVKSALDELQTRSFIKLPTRPPSPPPVQYVKVNPSNVAELPPLVNEVYTLGAMKWEENPAVAAKMKRTRSAATLGPDQKLVGRPLSAYVR